MKTSALVQILCAGTLFGFWPLIMKKADPNKFQPIAQALVIAVMTTIVITLAFALSGVRRGSGSQFFTSQVVFALVAGGLNGLGMTLFLRGTGEVSSVQVSRLILIMILTQIVMNEVGGMLLHGAPMTLRKGAGFASAVATAFLLVK